MQKKKRSKGRWIEIVDRMKAGETFACASYNDATNLANAFRSRGRKASYSKSYSFDDTDFIVEALD